MSGRQAAQLWVFAGPNGAGKTTITRRFVQARIPLVNPDAIAQQTARRPDGSINRLEAGRVALQQRAGYLAEGVLFGFETTLSGRSEFDTMRTARKAGYKINLVFVGIDKPATSHFRVQDRVSKGGHDVPSDDLTRRYSKSLNALFKASHLADRVIVFDNTAKQHLLVSIQENQKTRIVRPLPEWLKATEYGRMLSTIQIK